MADTYAGARPLEERTAFISGSGRGIGRGIALAMADAGATVAVLARNAEQIAATVTEIEGRGGTAFGVAADLRDATAVAGACAEVLEQLGGVDILVNNAGINVKRPIVPLPVAEGETAGQPGSGAADIAMSDDEWDAILDTHLRASLHLIRAFVPGMLAQRWGRVINVGSSAVGRSPNLVTPYKVAKGALTHLTISLAKEWAPYGVTVNTVAPGQFRTDMSKALHDSPKGQAWLRDRIPMRHAGDIRELGALAVHLAGELSSFITGQTIYVDGGETL
nr:SDR family NAD(P)-dependent oxidoreductase [Microbacterium bovistercoris]